MVMKGKIKGMKRCQNIEILEIINNIPNSSEMTIEFEITSTPSSEDKQILTVESRLAKLNQLFGDWKDQPELIAIFAKNDKERHLYRGRKIDELGNKDNI